MALRDIPCSIGDEVYVIRKVNGKEYARKGKVSQMIFVGVEMRLSITVSEIARGEWGKTIFSTKEDAEKSIKHGAIDNIK